MTVEVDAVGLAIPVGADVRATQALKRVLASWRQRLTCWRGLDDLRDEGGARELRGGGEVEV